MRKILVDINLSFQCRLSEEDKLHVYESFRNNLPVTFSFDDGDKTGYIKELSEKQGVFDILILTTQ